MLQIYLIDRIQKNKTGGACSVFGLQESYTGFCWGNLREMFLLGNPSVQRRILLRWIFRMCDVVVCPESR